MEKLFITTVGTSLITNTGILDYAESTKVMSESLSPAPSAAVLALLEKLAETLRANHELVFKTAEFATFLLYQRTVDATSTTWYSPGARYVFVGTDTYHGRFVLKLFRELITKYYPTVSLSTDIYVPGLNVGVAGAYDTAQHELYTKLKALTKAYAETNTATGTAYADRVICNLTGGFKFVSGWMHTYATIHGHCIVYRYELSNEVILTRPRIAVDFPTPLHI
jgi:CRISPR/Cas system-associated protein Csm6